MIEGITKTGFSFNADETVLDDWRFVKYIAKTKSKNMEEQIVATTGLVDLLLGEDEEERLMSHIAERNNGHIPQKEVINTVINMIEIMTEILKTSKKSCPSPE